MQFIADNKIEVDMQVADILKGENTKVQETVIVWGKDKSIGWLQILNDHWLSPKGQYLCGNKITIADYFGVALVTASELVHCNLAAYPNVERWFGNVRKRPSYAKIYETFNGFCASTKGQPWQAF